ncbi:ABC transporter substrate-binding protein [Aeromonas media]|uniref:ABC transporter substrate-binding protein n=1 Tax=Aeromonas media TaxID=651 RepID=A0AAW5RP59_AERME|nr:ABC transporter substrate-binding protein [Aeromonas media]AHX60462.1 periplasmic binding protein [Aeromonas media WS]MBP8279949.1 ABC transporter substrate-binding protein [Aeromonas sp.]MCV3290277.1 ABC transporter substrate-binding protein [Aeromonas media]QQQ15231.1 ABC transporter substrate-binding protein [Aeromonas media]
MKIFSPLAAALMLASLVGFQAQAGTRQVLDANGQTHTVPDAPQRVVVLSELDLDSALTLGVQPVGTVNGRGQSTLPRYLLDKAGKEIAVVGDLDNPNLEKLIDLEPDLILTGQTKPELLALLKEIAPTVVTGNWGEPWKTVFNRSANVMNKEAEAKAFFARYDARLAEARSKLAKHQGEQMSIVRWNPKGPSYMHGGTFASSVVTEMGLARPAHQIGDKSPHSPALSLESLNLLDGDWLVVGTLSTSGDAVDAMKQAEQTPAFQQLGAIKGKRFGAVDGSLWTSTGGPQAALKVIDDVEQLLTKPDAAPITQ